MFFIPVIHQWGKKKVSEVLSTGLHSHLQYIAPTW